MFLNCTTTHSLIGRLIKINPTKLIKPTKAIHFRPREKSQAIRIGPKRWSLVFMVASIAVLALKAPLIELFL